MRFKTADGFEVRGNASGFKVGGVKPPAGCLFIRLGGERDAPGAVFATRAVVPIAERGDKIRLLFHPVKSYGNGCLRRPDEIFYMKSNAQYPEDTE